MTFTSRRSFPLRAIRLSVAAARAVRNLASDLRHRHIATWTPGLGGGGSNSDHRVLKTVFQAHVRPDDVLVDMGCGRGRVLAHWQRHYSSHRRVGLEMDPRLASAAAQRFATEPGCHVVAGDGVTGLPCEATFVFMFNPFGASEVEALRERMERLPAQRPPLRVVYSNPKHLSGFESSPRWKVTRMRGGGSRWLPHHEYALIDRIDPGAASPDPTSDTDRADDARSDGRSEALGSAR